MTQSACSSTHTNSNEKSLPLKIIVTGRIRKLQKLMMFYSKHSRIKMSAANLHYTGDNDTVRCDACNLEVSEWTEDMVPFTVHFERSPECSFVRSQLLMNLSESDDQENPPKRQKTTSNSNQCKYNYKLVEVKSLSGIRCRLFSHWPRRMKPSSEQMMVAGFFSCNVGDRVICLYCNLICQQWKAEIDDPSEVHRTLSPRCPYVLSMLTDPELSPTLILNDIVTNNVNNQTTGLNNTTEHRFDQIVYTRPCHSHYSDINKRLESFATWSQGSAPPVDELVRAGFFYTGASSIVTCFYCNGSLQNWSATDKPINEHARWFGHCPYAKQMCGDDLHRRIQEANRARQERERTNQSNERNENSRTSTSNRCQLQISDSSMLARLVAARLDLSNSQNLLDQNFKLSVIKRCWEDQLQLKKDDFVSNSDLFVCCVILQKQIDCIQGNKENIIVPSERMRLLREREQSGLSTSTISSNNSNEEASENQSIPPSSTTTVITKEQSDIPETNSTIVNPCIICYQDEKRLACIPCGHFTACVPCSHSLRICPICRRGIEAFVRIYI